MFCKQLTKFKYYEINHGILISCVSKDINKPDENFHFITKFLNIFIIIINSSSTVTYSYLHFILNNSSITVTYSYRAFYSKLY